MSHITRKAPVILMAAVMALSYGLLANFISRSTNEEMPDSAAELIAADSQAVPEEGITIISQPEDAFAVTLGETVSFRVEAEGQGLRFLWYYSDDGTNFYPTAQKTSVYTIALTGQRNGRYMYCELTDREGRSLRTNTVRMFLAQPLEILSQPQDTLAMTALDRTDFSVTASGEGLTYRWYYADRRADGTYGDFIPTTSTSGKYNIPVTAARHARAMYCEVGDKYGRTVRTNTVYMYLAGLLRITLQPQPSVVGKYGELACFTVETDGTNQTYKWYYDDPLGDGTYSELKATAVTSRNYSVQVTSGRVGRRMYCRITDKNGNSVLSEPAEIVYCPAGDTEPRERAANAFYDADLTAGPAEQELISTGFSFTDAGAYAKGPGTLSFRGYTSAEKATASARFTAGEGAVIRFGCDASRYYTTTQSSVMVQIDADARTMTAYRCSWAEIPASVIGSCTLDFNVADGTEWCIELTKNTADQLTVRLYNTGTPEIGAVIENSSRAMAGDPEHVSDYTRCLGGGRLSVISGPVTVTRMTMVSHTDPNVRVMIIGDSYVENSSRDPKCRYASYLDQVIPEGVYMSGRGGANAADVLARLPYELSVCDPEICIINVGTNDGPDGFKNYKADMEKILAILDERGITPVLTTAVRRMDTDNLDFVKEANEWVRGSGRAYIDNALIMSQGDGETQNEEMFQTDLVHPTRTGGAALYGAAMTVLGPMLGIS